MFNKEKFITSDQDLKNIFNSCKSCAKITDSGNLIVSYNKLLDLHLPFQQKICIIINTNNSARNDVGHWFLIALNRNIHQAFIYDSLDSLHDKNPLALRAAKQFCKLNNFLYTIIHCPTQKQSSLNCGYVIAYFVHVFHNSNLNHFKKICLMFKQIKIEKAERYIMNNVSKVFTSWLI